MTVFRCCGFCDERRPVLATEDASTRFGLRVDGRSVLRRNVGRVDGSQRCGSLGWLRVGVTSGILLAGNDHVHCRFHLRRNLQYSNCETSFPQADRSVLVGLSGCLRSQSISHVTESVRSSYRDPVLRNFHAFHVNREGRSSARATGRAGLTYVLHHVVNTYDGENSPSLSAPYVQGRPTHMTTRSMSSM